jgi:small GTP-binding protein
VRALAVFADGKRALCGLIEHDIEVWDIVNGTCLRRLKGHTDIVLSVAVLTDQRHAISSSSDGTVCIWNLEDGVELRRFTASSDPIYSVIALAGDRQVITAGQDKALCIWDLGTGKALRQFNLSLGTSDMRLTVDERKAILAGDDGTVGIFDLSSELERRHPVHKSHVVSLAVLPNQRQILSGALDGTIALSDLEAGTELLRLEGHTRPVTELIAMPDGRHAISASNDKTIRFWDLQTGIELRRFEGHTEGIVSLGLLSSRNQIVSGAHDRTLRVWDIDPVQDKSGDGVRYTTARIALLGDSGVGKTGLGWRIAHDEFREHSSTHGQQFWLVDQLRQTRDDGTQCEAVLWDLAGQPDYRLIHALFLDKVDLGLLLFDPANRERPLAGVEYWVHHLRSATSRGSAAPSKNLPTGSPMILVGARSDRGSPSMSASEIHGFCQKNGIAAYFLTSAKDDVGIANLVSKIKECMPWQQLTTTTTTNTFNRIREYVLKLKEMAEYVILTSKQLRGHLKRIDPKWSFTEVEMITAVSHLANHGYVTVIQRADGQQAILLAPDLIVNLASSIVLEARRHERGLGIIDEARLLTGSFLFPELLGLNDDECKALIDAAISLFLQRNLCFRETVNNRVCLVFPSLINEKRPTSNDLGMDDVSYVVSGDVETVYAALVVQLGYTNLFQRDHHWQNQAQYELGPDERCCFRQIAEQSGEIELVLSYSVGSGDDTKKLFQGVLERFLRRRKVRILRFPVVRCKNFHLQARVNVRGAIANSRTSFFCNECGAEISTPPAENIGLVVDRQIYTLQEAEQTAARRTSYEVALAWIKAFRRDRDDNDHRLTCFLSYAWGDRAHERWVEELADNLQRADVSVILDRWHNTPATSVTRFIEQIEKSDYVCAVGTKRYRTKDEAQQSNPVVQAEMRLIKTKLRKRDEIRRTVIPLLREGTAQEAFPPLFEDSVFIDFREEADFLLRLFELLLTVYRIPFDNEVARVHRSNIAGESLRDYVNRN